MTLKDDIRNNRPSAIVFLGGAWVVAAPFIFTDTGIGVTLNGVIFGLILMGYGGYDIKQKQIWGQRLARYWAMTALGLWIAATPWFFGVPNPLRTSNLVTGLVIAVVSAYQLYIKSGRSISPSEIGSDFRRK